MKIKETISAPQADVTKIIIKKKHSPLIAIGGVIIAVLLIIIIVVSSLLTMFFINRDKPEEIFIFGYGVVIQKESGGQVIRLVSKTSPEALENGDGVVYVEGGEFKAANMMLLPESGKRAYFSGAELDVQVDAEENYVGKVVAVWQQNRLFGSIM